MKVAQRELSESEFLQKFKSNQIAQATITVIIQTGGTSMQITGNIIKTDKDGKSRDNEVPFHCSQTRIDKTM